MEAVWRQRRARMREVAVRAAVKGGSGGMYRAAAKGGGGGTRQGQRPVDVGGDTWVGARECLSWKFSSVHHGGEVCE